MKPSTSRPSVSSASSEGAPSAFSVDGLRRSGASDLWLCPQQPLAPFVANQPCNVRGSVENGAAAAGFGYPWQEGESTMGMSGLSFSGPNLESLRNSFDHEDEFYQSQSSFQDSLLYEHQHSGIDSVPIHNTFLNVMSPSSRPLFVKSLSMPEELASPDDLSLLLDGTRISRQVDALFFKPKRSTQRRSLCSNSCVSPFPLEDIPERVNKPLLFPRESYDQRQLFAEGGSQSVYATVSKHLSQCTRLGFDQSDAAATVMHAAMTGSSSGNGMLHRTASATTVEPVAPQPSDGTHANLVLPGANGSLNPTNLARLSADGIRRLAASQVWEPRTSQQPYSNLSKSNPLEYLTVKNQATGLSSLEYPLSPIKDPASPGLQSKLFDWLPDGSHHLPPPLANDSDNPAETEEDPRSVLRNLATLDAFEMEAFTNFLVTTGSFCGLPSGLAQPFPSVTPFEHGLDSTAIQADVHPSPCKPVPTTSQSSPRHESSTVVTTDAPLSADGNFQSDRAAVSRGEKAPTDHHEAAQYDQSTEDARNALCEEELTDEVLSKIPLDESGQLLSYGSIAHAEGNCKPCVFFHNPSKGCKNGARCLFCHFAHAPKKRVRLSKRKRAEVRMNLQESTGAKSEGSVSQRSLSASGARTNSSELRSSSPQASPSPLSHVASKKQSGESATPVSSCTNSRRASEAGSPQGHVARGLRPGAACAPSSRGSSWMYHLGGGSGQVSNGCPVYCSNPIQAVGMPAVSNSTHWEGTAVWESPAPVQSTEIACVRVSEGCQVKQRISLESLADQSKQHQVGTCQSLSPISCTPPTDWGSTQSGDMGGNPTIPQVVIVPNGFVLSDTMAPQVAYDAATAPFRGAPVSPCLFAIPATQPMLSPVLIARGSPCQPPPGSPGSYVVKPFPNGFSGLPPPSIQTMMAGAPRTVHAHEAAL